MITGTEDDSSCDHSRSMTSPVTDQPTAQNISGPYMHLSECFTGGGQVTSARTRTSSTRSSRDTDTRCYPTSDTDTRCPVQPSFSQSLCEESLGCGDDSVFLPNSPVNIKTVTSNMASMSLTSNAPGRPPKPPNLRNVQLAHMSMRNRNDNYENHEEFSASSYNDTKVETNNNCDTPNPTFYPPTVDRRLKPEISSGSSSSGHNTLQGPPVERNRKPRHISDGGGTYPGHSDLVPPPGMSIPGHRDTWEEGSNGSEGGSVRCSSDEQIYFYMPSLNTQSYVGSNGRWDPILIPASELQNNAVQYLDLDLPVTDTSFNDTGALSDRSLSRMRGAEETVYKTVDFVKTEAFNRTRQKVEEYKYNIKQDK